MIKRFFRDETGLELSEYAVAAALIALAVVGVFTTLGGNIKTVISNLATNIKNSAKSNEAGTYTIAQLMEGTYTVRAEAAGFKTLVVENVVLAARDIRRVDARLESLPWEM